MNKFKNVEHSKRNLVLGIISCVLAILFCIAISCVHTTKTKTAYATPSKESVQSQIASKQEQLDFAAADYNEKLIEKEQAEAKVDEAQAVIDDAEEKIPQYKSKFDNLVKNNYRNGPASMLDIILDSSTISEFLDNIEFAKKINNENARTVQEYTDLRNQVAASKVALDENYQIAKDAAAAAYSIKESVEGDIASLNATLESLTEQEREAIAAAEQRNAAPAPSGGNSGGSGNSGGGSSAAHYVPGSVVANAYAALGKPYVFGAAGPNSFDCSGLVSWCYCGHRAWTTYSFVGCSDGWHPTSNPAPGDVCSTSSHCGIYIGGGQMIHAPHTGDVVKIAPVQGGMGYYTRY